MKLDMSDLCWTNIGTDSQKVALERTSDADPKSGVLESIMVIEKVADIERSSPLE